MAEAEAEQDTLYSNVSVVRDLDGKHHVYVGTEKVLGIGSYTMQPLNDGTGIWTFAIPSSRVRLSERVPALPVFESSNVLPFNKHTTEPPKEPA